MLIRLLFKKFGFLAQEEKRLIKSINNFNKLDNALDEILFAENKEQVLNKLK